MRCRYISTIKKLLKKLTKPVFIFKPRAALRYFSFWSDYFNYKKLPGAEKICFADLFPILNERTATTAIDPHYFYQAVWAFNKILKDKPSEHVDIGSQVDLIGFLTAVTKVKFVDIRPLDAQLPNLENIKGDILNLPFKDNSIGSLSCLHVAEHIGLGRYGDPLDPLGTKKSCAELARVLAPGGHLYFSVPIGKERVQFNAHRIHQPQTILDYLNGLKLTEFSAIDDKGKLHANAQPANFNNSKSSCGLFHFSKI